MQERIDNITFDLETLGNTSDSPIVQIGAVKFTDEGKIYDEFNRKIKFKSLDRYKFEVNYDTLEWWFNQSDEAIKSVFGGEDKIDIRLAIREFQEWIGKPSQYVYWSHATFDPPILKNNFKKVGLECTIHYRSFKDIRTLTHLVGEFKINRTGIHHDALDDCKFQADYISKGLMKLKEMKIKSGLFDSIYDKLKKNEKLFFDKILSNLNEDISKVDEDKLILKILK